MKMPANTSPDKRPGVRHFEWVVVYHPRIPHFFWAEWLKQGFRHCELWRPYSYGDSPKETAWLRVTPTFEILEAEMDFNYVHPRDRYPGCTVQPVEIFSRAYKVRQWFHIGPISCVETVKDALGINKFLIRTPWQLYQYIKRHGGVLKHV